MVAQAFVLGAGLGTRLRPLTEDLPKPLVPIFQKPLITFALDHLVAAGVRSFVINTHHLPELFDHSFPGGRYRQLPVRLVHEPVLLETGGGIKNAEPFLGHEPFLVYSGDILTDLPLTPLLEEHFRRGNDVTLALRQTEFAPQVALRERRIIDIGQRYGHAGNFDYANVSVWNREIFSRLVPEKKISFIPVLAEWIGAGGKIGGVVLSEGRWFNLGSPREYLGVHRAIAAGWRPGYVSNSDWPQAVAPEVEIDPSASVRGFFSVGPGCKIGLGASVEDSILWPGAQIAPDARLKGCIVRTQRRAEGALIDTVI
jgi:mannose-1-phosphate guanylyltransferase